jgi:hypothetical protein
MLLVEGVEQLAEQAPRRTPPVVGLIGFAADGAGLLLIETGIGSVEAILGNTCLPEGGTCLS